ncbi:hypothetical protein MUU74_06035 [Chryseobacterium daecheongense]|uniref:hypothetical protein n=1 Tax=Chryseobacterium daecheongense TaxID=192389 RepID=UPI001FD6E20D|nr:hypothetical protein [Chryseobacterium daecheongense]UOU99514.1 hypothetical protein MUU74_06035 [Chryseobacterium daecheongense]
MKHIIFLFLLIVVSCKKGENRKEKMIPKDETLDLKYEILNQLINRTEPSSDNYVFVTTLKRVYLNESDKFRPQGIIVKYDSIFLLEDSAYYKNQEKAVYDFRFVKKRINKNLEYTTDEELHKSSENGNGDFWTDFRKKYGNKCIQRFSVPFFNKDKTMCVVQNSTSCGPLDGNGYTAIYKKVDGKWIEVRTFDHWIS